MKIRKQFLLLFISTSHLFVYAQNTEPSMFTKEANEQVVKSLPFDNKQDFEDATRGFIATIDEPSITDETGKEVYGLTVWDSCVKRLRHPPTLVFGDKGNSTAYTAYLRYYPVKYTRYEDSTSQI